MGGIRRRTGVLCVVAGLTAVGSAFAQNTTVRASVSSPGGQSNAVSGLPAISGDGRYVAFASSATNLVPRGDTNGSFDVSCAIVKPG